MKNTIRAIAVGLFLIPSISNAVTIVAPGAAADTEGDTYNVYPFNCCSARYYQQLYDSSLFGGQSGIIDEIRFRFDGGSRTFSESMNLEIRLSHTSVTPDSMSTTFANNVGADETVVLSGNVLLSGTETIGVSPGPFNIVFDVDDLFSFNGFDNLLLQISIISSGSGLGWLDAVSSSFEGAELLQRVWSPHVGATTGISLDPRGLVTAFEIIPNSIPEPATLGLFGFGLMGLGLAARRRRAER